MKLREQLERMTDYRKVFAPFMSLEVVGRHWANARVLSYILHRMRDTDTGMVDINGGEYREIGLSPFHYYLALQALYESGYVAKHGTSTYTVDVTRLMEDIQATESNQPPASR